MNFRNIFRPCVLYGNTAQFPPSGPCFGSLFPPLAVLTFAASSIIEHFGLASAAPRSPYRHL